MNGGNCRSASLLTAVLVLENEFDVNEKMIAALPSQEVLKDAIVRLKITYPQGYEVLIDETRLHTYTKDAFEFKLHKIAVSDARSRLPEGQETSSLSPLQLLVVLEGKARGGRGPR